MIHSVKDSGTEWQTDRQRDRQTGRQTDRQTDRRTDGEQFEKTKTGFDSLG